MPVVAASCQAPRTRAPPQAPTSVPAWHAMQEHGATRTNTRTTPRRCRAAVFALSSNHPHLVAAVPQAQRARGRRISVPAQGDHAEAMPAHPPAGSLVWLPACWLAPSVAPGPLHRTSLHDIRPVTPLVLSHFTALCLTPNWRCNLNGRASPQLPGFPYSQETGCRKQRTNPSACRRPQLPRPSWSVRLPLQRTNALPSVVYPVTLGT
jgi:hypothetical protein